jgi:holliday junction resolvase Hjr
MKSELMTPKEIKRMGIKHEQDLVKLFKDNDFSACRLAASGISNPDILAANGEQTLILEVKTSRINLIRVRTKQVYTLRTFAQRFKAKAYIAAKFLNRSNWRFVELQYLHVGMSGFSLDYNTAELKGLSFDEILSNVSQTKLI